MYQPQLIEVDPQRIKFNKFNPRKHGGEEYERLKQSIQEMGIIQPPLIRHTTGIFYEAIDGEGRVSVAQDLALPTIKALSLGDVTEDEALEKLVISNVVRQFDFFAQCKGMAALHRKGKTAEKISKELGIPYPGMAIRDIALGYFPEEIYSCILSSIQDKAQVWSNHTMLYELLPLRQVLPGKDDPRSSGIIEGSYDYSEVKRAVEKVVKGDITNGTEMRAYVAERRRELYEQRFSEELQQRLKDEIARAEKALEEAKTLNLEKAAEKARQEYQTRIDTLEAQLNQTKGERDKALVATAASKRDKKAIEGLQQALDAEKAAKIKVKESVRTEERKKAEAEYKEWKEKYEAEAKDRREAIEKERVEAKARLEEEQKISKEQLVAYYKEQDAKRQLKAQTSYKNLVANVSERLSQSRQSVDHIVQQEMIRGMEWLTREEIGELLLQIRIVRTTLDEAEQAIQKQIGVVSSQDEASIESDKAYERSLVNHG